MQLWGTLSCQVMVHPRQARAFREALNKCVHNPFVPCRPP